VKSQSQILSQIVYPIVKYARMIKKNTAEFTANDMAKFMKWWVKQPTDKGVLAMGRTIKAQSKKEITVDKGNGKSRTKVTLNELKDVDMSDVEMESNEEQVVEEAVLDLALTQQDIDALIWGIETLLREFTYEGEMESTKETLQSFLEAIKSE